MKTEVRNEFILEAHKSACSEWKLKIEKECPELFKNKLEVGKWYNYYKGALLVWNNGGYSYGFINGKYREDWSFCSQDAEPATEEEVKEALIKEAKKRGFKSGLKIKPLWDTPHSFWNLSGNNFEFNFKDNSLFLSSWRYFAKK